MILRIKLNWHRKYYHPCDTISYTDYCYVKRKGQHCKIGRHVMPDGLIHYSITGGNYSDLAIRSNQNEALRLAIKYCCLASKSKYINIEKLK
jgi:hypothetical protein